MTQSTHKLLSEFLALHPKIIDLDLSRVHDLLARLGNPERKCPPVIHVAGTNGKGSVVAFLRAMAEAAGFNVHVYISPHLIKFHERIRLAGKIIDEDRLAILLEEISKVNLKRPITFFEITTCAAFKAFSETPADLVILETGLGGRLDATNVIDKPALSIITPISMDHQQYLGNSIGKIAIEKAFIQKPNCDSIIAPQENEALIEIEKIAQLQKAKPYFAGKDWDYRVQKSMVDGKEAVMFTYIDLKDGSIIDLPQPSLIGEHQYENAATAVAAFLQLQKNGTLTLNQTDLLMAIRQGLIHTVWAARMQEINFGALAQALPRAKIILDGGHNQAAGHRIANEMARLSAQDDLPLVMAVGMLSSKEGDSFLSPFAKLSSLTLTIPIPDQIASLSEDELAVMALASGHKQVQALSHPQKIAEAIEASGIEGEFRLLITGSLYLSGYFLGEWGYEIE